jgi:anti-anti-sigma factor
MKKQRVEVEKRIDESGIAVFTIRGSIVTNLGVTSVKKLAYGTVASMERPRIIFNLAQVDYLDSFSFGWIMSLYRDIVKKGGDFVICCPNEDILYMFKLTEFLRVVPSFETLEDAYEAVLTGEKSKKIVYL